MKTCVLLMAIGLGGGIGAAARHLMSLLFHAVLGMPVFAAIMIVNILGCFLIGMIFFLLEVLLKKDTHSRLHATTLAKPLLEQGWWPTPDPTQLIERDFKQDLKADLLAAFLITGILGGMTTFSLFSLISLNLVQNGSYLEMLVNAVGTVVAGFFATYLGLIAGRSIALRWSKSIVR